MSEQIHRGMKAKTIKAVLSKKFGEFLESIDDNEIRTLVKKNTIITGGCIASMLLGEEVNDFDLYFTDKNTTKKVAQYYVNRFKLKIGVRKDILVQDTNPESTTEGQISVVVKSMGIVNEDGKSSLDSIPSEEQETVDQFVGDVITDPGEIEDVYYDTETTALNTGGKEFRPVFMSTNAITLSDKIQLVLRFYGEPEEIIRNYDFVHVSNYWKSGAYTSELVLNQAALESLLAKELRYVGSLYPVCSVIRLRKFIKRGWTVNAGQILKMMMQVSDLNLRDIDVLREQCVGVDSSFFSQVLDKLNKNGKPEDNGELDYAYLIEIIDKIF